MNRVFWLTVFAIFAVPLSCWIPIKNGNIWFTQYLALLAVFGIGISVVLWKFDKTISLFTLCCLFSTIFTARYHPRALMYFFQVEFSCLAMYVVSLFNFKQRKIILWVILALTVFQGIYVIIQYFNMDPFFHKLSQTAGVIKGVDDTVGLNGSHNQSGLFFAATMPIVVSLCPWISIVSIFAIYCSTTITATIGSVIGMWFYFAYRSGKAVILYSLVILLSVWVFFANGNMISMKPVVERYLVAKHSIEAVINKNIRHYSLAQTQSHTIARNPRMRDGFIKCNPWFGYGLGNFMRISPYTQIYINSAHRYSHAHNDLIETFFEMGWVGLISALLVILSMVWKFIRAKKTKLLIVVSSCLLIQFICSMGVFTVQTAVSGMILIIYVGLFMGEIRDNAK